MPTLEAMAAAVARAHEEYESAMVAERNRPSQRIQDAEQFIRLRDQLKAEENRLRAEQVEAERRAAAEPKISDNSTGAMSVAQYLMLHGG